MSSKRAVACLFALVFSMLAAGCHHNNLTSGYGIGWVTLTEEPATFASYIVTVQSVILTGKVDGAITAVSTAETVDFTKLKDVSELWAGASIPNDTFTAATITLDYTNANISVLVNGAPQQATVVGATGAAVTTISVTVNLDPTNLAYIIPTYATTSGIRLALDFDLAASNNVNYMTTPATVTVKPYFTVATSASDNKLILVRGPLVNTSVNEQTYSVYVRPFFDEVNTVGTLTMFDNASNFSGSATQANSPACPGTVPLFTVNGISYTGQSGISVLSQTSAGSTMTASYTTYVPTTTPIATAAIFCTVRLVGGSTLEDFYTDGLEGDVIARSGNTLTVRSSTLFQNAAQSVTFLEPDSQILVGPITSVVQDGSANAALDYNSISVGQHIIARGEPPNPVATPYVLDATSAAKVNTGSVRIQSTQAFGTLVSSATGSLEMNLADIGIYPASVFNFAGTGTSAATDAVPASYLVNTGALALPTDLAVGGAVWTDGVATSFGSAPPDFNAVDVEDEASVPATLIVNYTASTANNAAVFATLTSTGLTLNLGDSLLLSAKINVGAEVIDVTTLPATPMIVPVSVTAPPPIQVATANITKAQLPPVFLPLFSFGSNVAGVNCFNDPPTFVSKLTAAFAAATPASVLAVTARGSYNRVANQFTADSINVVLD